MLSLTGVFAFIFIVLNLMLFYIVIRPVTRLSQLADEVSMGNMEAPDLRSRERTRSARWRARSTVCARAWSKPSNARRIVTILPCNCRLISHEYAEPPTLGKYAITETLGKGAMGVVYKGFDPHIKRTVAIKTIRRDCWKRTRPTPWSPVSRMKHKLRAPYPSGHRRCPRIWRRGKSPFIVMEYVQGNGLDQYFKREIRFGVTDIVSIAARSCSMRSTTRTSRGIVHRDIKPANIMSS
jgi:serine/threonine protein kinase